MGKEELTIFSQINFFLHSQKEEMWMDFKKESNSGGWNEDEKKEWIDKWSEVIKKELNLSDTETVKRVLVKLVTAMKNQPCCNQDLNNVS